MSRLSKPLAALAFGGGVTAAALLGSQFNPGRGKTARWYRKLKKPPFNPPNSVFPIVWPVLYTITAISGYRVWRASTDSSSRTAALSLWSVQLALNAAWSPLFFGAKRPDAALADVIALFGAVGAYVATAARVDTKAALLAVPYLAWIGFATTLNEEIVRRNR